MTKLNTTIGDTKLKLCFNCLENESRKEKRSEDRSTSSAPLSTDEDITINCDSLEQSEDVSMQRSV